MKPDRSKESLAREVWAILFLYLAISLLPLVIGWALAPAGPG